MAKIIRNGQNIGFDSKDATLVNYVKPDGSRTTVQAELNSISQNIADLRSAPILLYDSVAEGKTDIAADMTGTIEDITHFKEIIITNNFYNNVLFSRTIPSNYPLNCAHIISASDPFATDKVEFNIRFTSNTTFKISGYSHGGSWSVRQLLIYGIK